jgi:hypothetical protein
VASPSQIIARGLIPVKRKTSLSVSGAVVIVALFVFLVPAIHVPELPSNCAKPPSVASCAYIGHGPFYESLTHWLVGDGVVNGGPFCCHKSGYFIDWSGQNNI